MHARGRILVVDDEPDVREAVETALELEGHLVTTAADGLEALARLQQATSTRSCSTC